MIVGVERVVCTCEVEMIRTGGHFGGDSPVTDTYDCSHCRKHIIVITPREKEQLEFVSRWEAKQ